MNQDGRVPGSIPVPGLGQRCARTIPVGSALVTWMFGFPFNVISASLRSHSYSGDRVSSWLVSGGHISGNAHEGIVSTAGKWGHTDKVWPECGRCSYSVKQVMVYIASQADQLAPVHKTDLSFITFSTEGPSLWFSRENQCQRHSSSSAVSSMRLPLASNTEEENHLKGGAERTFLLLPPGQATRGDLLFQISAPEPARKHKRSS